MSQRRGRLATAILRAGLSLRLGVAGLGLGVAGLGVGGLVAAGLGVAGLGVAGLGVAGLGVGVAACQGPPPGAAGAGGVSDDDKAPPPMPPAEQRRGLELCQGYLARVCACADRLPDRHREQCALARSQPEALKLHLALLEGREGALNANERRAVEGQARAVIAACVRSDSALDPSTCPRTGTGSTPPSP